MKLFDDEQIYMYDHIQLSDNNIVLPLHVIYANGYEYHFWID